jgi:putative ABC transport system permease protein
MGNVWKDIRYAARVLRKSPGFTTVVVLSLALGIGANTAIFSVVNAVLLQPLPFTGSDRLVQLWETETAVPKAPLAGPDYFDWRSQNQTLQATTLYGWPTSLNLSSTGEADHVFGIPAEANFFSLLGARPLIGRGFLDGEDQSGRNHVAVLSYGLWQRRFGGKPEALGQEIELSGEEYQVVGVMPANFEFPFQADLWLPMDMNPNSMYPRGSHSYRAIGRLKPGITPQQAESNLQAIAKNLERQYPNSNDQIGAAVVPLREQLVGRIRPALLVLLGAVALVLLIACVNVVNLLLARATARRREIAIRNALGATRSRLVRQLLTESVLLSIVAGIPGLLLGAWGVDLLRLLPGVPISNPNIVRVDAAVLFFAMGITVVAGVLFGMAPAFQAWRTEPQQDLKSGAKYSGKNGAPRRGLRDALVVGEIALSLALLIGAGLLLRSFQQLRAVDIGVRTENVLTAKIALPDSRFPKEKDKIPFYQQLVERLEQSPGIDAAGIASEVPLEGGSNGYDRRVEDPPSAQGPLVERNMVTPGYFAAMGIPFIAGRNFVPADQQLMVSVSDAEDQPGPPGKVPTQVAIVNRSFAQEFWPSQNAVGKLYLSGGENPTQVIGVVGDTRVFAPNQKTIPEAYFPLGYFYRNDVNIVVHGAIGPAALAATVRAEVKKMDAGLPVFEVEPMEHIIARSTYNTRFQALLLGTFAFLALVLSAVGIYGVMSYLVERRTREIGIRMTLGARPSDILRLILEDGMKLTVVGLAIGLTGALALTQLMASLLYGISERDPYVFVGVALLLGIVALIACWIPARRAMRVEPMSAIRYE